MTKRKYTDEEVIKALEFCVSNKYTCDGCPCVEGKFECVTNEPKFALDLINRQRAEIESLTQNNISTKYPTRVLCSLGVIFTKSLEDYDKLIGDISAEAIKEFAERLKEIKIKYALPLLGLQTKTEIESYVDDILLQMRDGIDRLVKEMTEGKQ